MAHPLNAQRQKVIDSKKNLDALMDQHQTVRGEYQELLLAQAGGTLADCSQVSTCEAKHRELEAKVSAARHEVTKLERELLTMEGQERAEVEKVARAAEGLGPVDEDHDRPALCALPALPSRTVRALGRLYPESYTPHESPGRFRSVLLSALGGMPLAPILAESMGEYSDPNGGFAVTPDVAAGIFVRAAEASLWMSLGVRVEQMTSSERIIIAMDDADESDNAEAGVKAGYGVETVAASAQAVKLRRVTLYAEKLVIYATLSNELVEDAGADFVPGIEQALIRALAKKFDRLTLTGEDGHTGILNGPGTITVAKETSQTADTFVYNNACKMWSRLCPGSHERSVWIMHPTVLPQALTMSAVGITNFAFPGVFAVGGPTGYLLFSRPVYISSRAKVLGTSGDVILCDPSQIAIGIRRGLTVARSDHAAFSQDMLALRASFRGCCVPLWETPRTPVEGSTVSPFVVLAER